VGFGNLLKANCLAPAMFPFFDPPPDLFRVLAVFCGFDEGKVFKRSLRLAPGPF